MVKIKKSTFSWGEKIPQEGRTKAGDYLCINRDCENSRWNSQVHNRIMLKDDYIIGVTKAEYGGLRFENESHYVAFVECPLCFEKFWYHILDTHAERLFKERNKKK